MINLNNKLKATTGKIETKLWYLYLLSNKQNRALTKLYIFRINNPIRNIINLIKY